MNIVCIDDEPLLLNVYKDVLKKVIMPGDTLIVTDSYQKVYELLSKSGIDLLITDLLMPEVSGFDILKKVKKEHPRIEVIVITGRASVDSAVEAIKLGARDYLEKPINTFLLYEKISLIREILQSKNETENYRFAKETIEDNAKKCIGEMEIKLDSTIAFSRTIEKIVLSMKTDSEKVDEIQHALKKYKIKNLTTLTNGK